MKDYVITRSSSDELRHWGIKGQKWGVRRFENPDGTLTEEGKKRYSQSSEKRALADQVKNSVYRGYGSTDYLHKVADGIRKHPVVQDIARKAKKSYDDYIKAEDNYHKEMDAFYKDKKTYEKYLNYAVNHFMREVGSKNPSYTREWAYDWFKYDDGDQGDHSSIELYKKSYEGKSLLSAEKSMREAYKKFKKDCKSFVSSYLGEYGEELITYPNQDSYKRSVTSRLSDHVEQLLSNHQRFKHWI